MASHTTAAWGSLEGRGLLKYTFRFRKDAARLRVPFLFVWGVVLFCFETGTHSVTLVVLELSM